MLRLRPWLPTALLVLAALPASADVVILKGNEVPLQGEIVSETPTLIRFRIRGLRSSSHIDIRKDRIKLFWRDSPDPSAIRRSTRPAREAPAKTRPETVAPDRPDPRTPDQIRETLLAKVRKRVDRLTPESTTTGSLSLFVLLIYATLILWLGGRLADMDELTMAQCSVLSLLTAILTVVDLYSYPQLTGTPAWTVILVAEVAAWVLFVRAFAGEPIRKGVLLLSFLVLGMALTALVLASVLAVF